MCRSMLFQNGFKQALQLRVHARKYATRARDYKAAVADLNTLQSNFSIVQMIRENRQEMNLKAIPEMVEWCRRIGYQPSDFDKLNPVHIAGTKGKGSTASFISSILAQYLPSRLSIHAERLPSNVGLYTSPHLRFVRERIQINNHFIDEEKFARYFYEIWDRLEATARAEGHPDPSQPATKPVYFRYLTLMALHCYLHEEVGTAVIECGIGGEYDSTNILSRPSVTGITSLGIDHTPILGDTLELIAWHKAGIFKKDVPAFTAPQQAFAQAVLQERAKEKGTALHVAPSYSALDNIDLGLPGEFQKTNAALAIAIAATHLQRMGFSNLPDPLNATAQLPTEFIVGLQKAHLGGRCEKRQDKQIARLAWYIDGAHTLESLQSAGRWYACETSQNTAKHKPSKILVFNQQARDRVGLVENLFETLAQALNDRHPFEHVIFCTNTTYKLQGYQADLVSINTDHIDVKALGVQQELAEKWQSIDTATSVYVVPTIEEAIEMARSLAQSHPTDVLVTGSLHLVGGVVEVLESESESESERSA